MTERSFEERPETAAAISEDTSVTDLPRSTSAAQLDPDTPRFQEPGQSD